MKFNDKVKEILQAVLLEAPSHPFGSKGNKERLGGRGAPKNVIHDPMSPSHGRAISHLVQKQGLGNVTEPSDEVKQKYLGWAFKVNVPLINTQQGGIDVISSPWNRTQINVRILKKASGNDGQEWHRGRGTEIPSLKADGTPSLYQSLRVIPAGTEGEITGYAHRYNKYQVVVDFVEPSGNKYTTYAWIGRIIKDEPFHTSRTIEWI